MVRTGTSPDSDDPEGSGVKTRAFDLSAGHRRYPITPPPGKKPAAARQDPRARWVGPGSPAIPLKMGPRGTGGDTQADHALG